MNATCFLRVRGFKGPVRFIGCDTIFRWFASWRWVLFCLQDFISLSRFLSNCYLHHMGRFWFFYCVMPYISSPILYHGSFFFSNKVVFQRNYIFCLSRWKSYELVPSFPSSSLMNLRQTLNPCHYRASYPSSEDTIWTVILVYAHAKSTSRFKINLCIFWLKPVAYWSLS